MKMSGILSWIMSGNLSENISGIKLNNISEIQISILNNEFFTIANSYTRLAVRMLITHSVIDFKQIIYKQNNYLIF